MRPDRKRENQRNDRVPKKIHNNRQPCPRLLDRIRHDRFPGHQFDCGGCISIGCAYRYLWGTKVSWLP